MFINYANYFDDCPSGYLNKSVKLQINSCGTYRLITRKFMETCRPNGRDDYQLIYIASGKGYFYFNNSPVPSVVDAGNIVIYQPQEFQKYEYYGADLTNVYWLHFTGNDVNNVFLQFGLDISEKIIHCETDSFYNSVFEQIIMELQLKKDFYQDLIILLFMQILTHIGRKNREITYNNSLPINEIETVISYFRENYYKNIDIEQFIVSSGYSLSSFFRKFKKYTGLSPLQYLISIRLSYAIQFLETSDYQICEIARLVGYDNPLYFSRLFYKHIGVSPNKYRSQQMKKNKR